MTKGMTKKEQDAYLKRRAGGKSLGYAIGYVIGSVFLYMLIIFMMLLLGVGIKVLWSFLFA